MTRKAVTRSRPSTRGLLPRSVAAVKKPFQFAHHSDVSRRALASSAATHPAHGPPGRVIREAKGQFDIMARVLGRHRPCPASAGKGMGDALRATFPATSRSAHRRRTSRAVVPPPKTGVEDGIHVCRKPRSASRFRKGRTRCVPTSAWTCRNVRAVPVPLRGFSAVDQRVDLWGRGAGSRRGSHQIRVVFDEDSARRSTASRPPAGRGPCA